ncbi:MFS transporter, partial [Campylobacter jejuni]|nr:MFS transporter [Campylobacter jejuni]
PVLSLYALKLEGANEFLVGLLVGVYALTQMILQMPFGILSDKIGRKKTMFIGLIIFIGSLICSFAENIYIMLLGRMLQGAGAIGAVATAMISDFITEENRGKAMAVMGSF